MHDINIVAIVENSIFAEPKVIQINGVNGEFPATPNASVIVPTSEAHSDVHVHGVLLPDQSGTGSVRWIDMCDRSGSPETVGEGTHIVFPMPVPVSLPEPTPSLGAVENPTAVVLYNGFIYMMDYDRGDIYAFNQADFSVAGRRWAYDGEIPEGMVAMGVALIALGGMLYALFNIGTNFTGPYEDSVLVRLAPTQAGQPALGTSSQDDYMPIGAKNSVDMDLVASYTPVQSQTEKNYFLISNVGGVQATGNGAFSKLTVVEIASDSVWALLGSPLVGTYENLDFKQAAVTLTDNNDAFVFLLLNNYQGPSMTITNFCLVQTTASHLIENALNNITEDVGAAAGYSFVIPKTISSGYFWGMSLSPSGNGVEGALVVGMGGGVTDNTELRIYEVTSAGASDETLVKYYDGYHLYGQAGGLLNSFLVVTPGLDQQKHAKSDRASLMRSTGINTNAGFASMAGNSQGKSGK